MTTKNQAAWETAMGMRGYAGSPAEREDRLARKHFKPGRDDQCANCGLAFSSHVNGVCPQGAA